MNVTTQGWLARYLVLRKKEKYGFERRFPSGSEFSDSPDKALYRVLVPSGILYGYPAQLPGMATAVWTDLSVGERMKLLLLESLLACGMLHSSAAESAEKEHIRALTEKIGRFYAHHYPLRSFFAFRKKKGLALTEYFLKKRIDIKSDWENFWTSFFHNILLFLDVIYFARWKKSQVSHKQIKRERDKIYMLILKTIAIAAKTGPSGKAEEQFYEYFLHSTGLRHSKSREAQKFIKQELSLEEVDFEHISSWLLRKYLLDLAILAVYLDREISPSEGEFLEKLRQKLRLTADDLENSRLAVESFVVANYEQVHYLTDVHKYKQVSDLLVRRMTSGVKRNKKRIAKEISESRELLSLLNKSRTQELTPEEKKKMHTQLLDVLKTVPMLFIVALPGSFLTLPVLFKILPPEVLYPSAFRE